MGHEAGREGGVSLNGDGLAWDHGQRRQAIVDSLLRDVFQGRLRAGQHLVTRELAGRFGVSHTPVREALIVLAGMGMLDLLPNRGAIVRRVTGRDIEAICQVRRALECEAVRSACGRIQPEFLQNLAEDLRGLATDNPAGAQGGNGSAPAADVVDRARNMDDRLHDLIAARCGNAFLAAELTRFRLLFRAFRDVAWEHMGARSDYRRVAEEAREHLAIVEALVAHKPQEAARAMARHVDAGCRYWSRAVDADRRD
jgi:DNA-binding GntR family transcriptional regulator